MRMEFVADNEPSRTILINGNCNADPIAYDKVEFEDSSEGIATELNAGFGTQFFTSSNSQRSSNVLSTNQSGNFQFVHKSNEDRFAVIAANVIDNNMLDGVTVFDLVKIQKHNLNIERFTKGYQYIAADANNSGSISTFDMIEINKVILGREPKFGDFNYAYRLIPEYIPIDYATEFNTNPFDMSQVNLNYFDYMVSEPGMPTNPNLPDKQVFINSNKVGFDAIKIGDVNSTNSHSPLASESIESRSPISISLGEFDCIRRGETKWIYAIGAPNKKIVAYQLGLEYDMDKIEVLEFKSDAYDEENDFWDINTADVEIGELKTLWLDRLTRERDFKEERWIALKIKAKSNLCTLRDLRRVFSLNTNALETRFLTEEGDDVGGEIVITTNPSDNIDGRENQVNSVTAYPNPASTQVLINIPVSRKTIGIIIVRDQLGNTIEKEIQFHQGDNQINLDLSDLSTGVIFYNIVLSEEEKSYNGKFIRM